MTDKEKIRKEVERLQNELIQEKEKGYSSDIDDACILELQNVLTYIDSLQEEPVSEDLEQAIDTYLVTYWSGEKEKQDWPFLKKMAIYFANWQKEQMVVKAIETTFNVSLPSGLYDKLWTKGCKEGDKLLVIKKDEL